MLDLKNKEKIERLIANAYDEYLLIGVYKENGEDYVDDAAFGSVDRIAMGLAAVALDNSKPQISERVRNILYTTILTIIANEDPEAMSFINAMTSPLMGGQKQSKECIKIKLTDKN